MKKIPFSLIFGVISTAVFFICSQTNFDFWGHGGFIMLLASFIGFISSIAEMIIRKKYKLPVLGMALSILPLIMVLYLISTIHC